MTTDRINEIIDRAVNYTEDILTRAPRHLRVARQELERMRHNLELDIGDHPALHKLTAYIEELEHRVSH